jgi:hypothetical protein
MQGFQRKVYRTAGCAAEGRASMVRVMHWATPEERSTLGQARRKQVGRQQHAEFNPKARKTSLPLLERSMRGRVPALIKLKYQLMAETPFAYFRGAVPVMAADLAVLPNTGILCQLCGDAHVRNLGAYAAPDGRLVFDINDFDETIRGPFESAWSATAPRCAPLPSCPAWRWFAFRCIAWTRRSRCMRRC